MTLFICICLLIMPWFFLPINGIGNQFRLPQAIFMDFTFLGVIFFGIKNGFKGYKNKYLSYFVAYIFFTFMIYLLIPLGLDFKGAGRVLALQNLWILEPLIHFILGLFAMLILLSTLTKEDYSKIAKTLCISAALMAVFVILQYTGFDPLKFIANYVCNNKVSACLDNPNLVGNYLALCIPLFFTLTERKYIPCLLMVVIAVAMAKSNFAIGLAMLGIITFALLHYRKNKYIVVAIVVVICFLIGAVFMSGFLKLDTGLDGRIPCWKQTIEHFKDNTLFGLGLGKFKTLNVRYGGVNPTVWTEAHNDWLERLTDIGIIGVFLFSLVVINTLRNFKLTDKQSLAYLSMFIVFLVMMFASFPMEIPSLAILGLISFCGIEKESYGQ